VFQRKKVNKKEDIPSHSLKPVSQIQFPRKNKNEQGEELGTRKGSIQTPAASAISRIIDMSNGVKRIPTNSAARMTPKQIIDKRRRRSSFATSTRPSSFGVNLVEGNLVSFNLFICP
jgi:hypothetical protein